MPQTTVDNLFTAAKANALAVRELYKSLGHTPSVVLPIHFLAGFAFELSLKAVIFAKRGDESELRRLGHDLLACLASAKSEGYIVPPGFGIEEVIEAIAPAHLALEYRYIPDVEVVQTVRLNHLLPALAKHIDSVEVQFEVWTYKLRH